MMQRLSGVILFLLFLVVPFLAGAGATGAPGRVDPTWYDHVDLMQLLLATVFGWLVMTFRAGVRRFEAAQEKAVEQLADIDKRLAIIETICDRNHGGQ